MSQPTTLPATDLMDLALYNNIEARNPATGTWVRLSGTGQYTTDDRTGKITDITLAAKMPSIPCDCPHDCGEMLDYSSHATEDGAIRLDGNHPVEYRTGR